MRHLRNVIKMGFAEKSVPHVRAHSLFNYMLSGRIISFNPGPGGKSRTTLPAEEFSRSRESVRRIVNTVAFNVRPKVICIN